VPGGEGVLYALNRFTGALRWQVDIHEELTTQPAMSEGRLLVMSSEQSVTAVDPANGKRLWKFPPRLARRLHHPRRCTAAIRARIGVRRIR